MLNLEIMSGFNNPVERSIRLPVGWGLGGQVYLGCHLDGWMPFYFSATVTLLAVLT